MDKTSKATLLTILIVHPSEWHEDHHAVNALPAGVVLHLPEPDLPIWLEQYPERKSKAPADTVNAAIDRAADVAGTVIVTYSDHVLLRARRLLVEGKIAPTDLDVLARHAGTDQSAETWVGIKIRPEDGEMENPSGYLDVFEPFLSGYRETLALQRAIRERGKIQDLANLSAALDEIAARRYTLDTGSGHMATHLDLGQVKIRVFGTKNVSPADPLYRSIFNLQPGETYQGGGGLEPAWSVTREVVS